MDVIQQHSQITSFRSALISLFGGDGLRCFGMLRLLWSQADLKQLIFKF